MHTQVRDEMAALLLVLGLLGGLLLYSIHRYRWPRHVYRVVRSCQLFLCGPRRARYARVMGHEGEWDGVNGVAEWDIDAKLPSGQV